MPGERKYGLIHTRPVAWAVCLALGIFGALGLTAMFQELFEFGADDPPASLSQQR